MNREILFRGKSYTDDKWHYGFYVHRHGTPFTTERHEIDDGALGWNCYPDTIGQYTGLTGKKGVKIFEGDIVKCKNYHGDVEGSVDYCGSLFYLACSSGYSDEYLFNCKDFEVIGNVYEAAQAGEGGRDE